MPTPSHAAPQFWQAVRQERETSRCKGKLCTQQDHKYRKGKASIQNSDFYFFPKLLIFYLPRRCKSKPQWDGSSLWPSHMSNFKSQGQRRWISQWRACPTSMQTCVGSPTPKERSWKNLLVIQALSRYKQLTSAAPRYSNWSDHHSNSVSLEFQGDTLSQKTRWM